MFFFEGEFLSPSWTWLPNWVFQHFKETISKKKLAKVDRDYTQNVPRGIEAYSTSFIRSFLRFLVGWFTHKQNGFANLQGLPISPKQAINVSWGLLYCTKSASPHAQKSVPPTTATHFFSNKFMGFPMEFGLVEFFTHFMTYIERNLILDLGERKIYFRGSYILEEGRAQKGLPDLNRALILWFQETKSEHRKLFLGLLFFVLGAFVKIGKVFNLPQNLRSYTITLGDFAGFFPPSFKQVFTQLNRTLLWNSSLNTYRATFTWKQPQFNLSVLLKWVLAWKKGALCLRSPFFGKPDPIHWNYDVIMIQLSLF